MTKYYEETTTRTYSLSLLKAWVKAEENLGLKNSFFLVKDGVITQYVDFDEGEKLHKELKKKLTTEYFAEVCDKFFKAIKKRDKVKMFECLFVFDEIDNYPKIANDDIIRRLKRVREATHEIIYSI